MSPIRTLLVDDEPLANAGLRALLTGHADVEIVAEALSGKDAVRLILELRPDLVFLDVQMPRFNGFRVLQAVMQRLPEGGIPLLVFATAYDDFALRAFEVQALDYLLKPIDEDRLREALRRVRAALSRSRRDGRAETLERRLRALLEEYGSRGTGPDSGPHLTRILVSVGPRSVPVAVADIDWIGARDYCAEIHVGAKSYVVRESLTTLESRLDPATFTRVHRSAIVNLSRVVELRRRALRGTSVVLEGGAALPVSRNRRAGLMERLGPRK